MYPCNLSTCALGARPQRRAWGPSASDRLRREPPPPPLTAAAAAHANAGPSRRDGSRRTGPPHRVAAPGRCARARGCRASGRRAAAPPRVTWCRRGSR